MKLGYDPSELDQIDLRILMLLQDNCKQPLAKIGEKVGLSAPSVVERVKKLEDSGIITGYRAILDARRLGKDITAFIGVSLRHSKLISEFEREISQLDGVLDCHHVTGEYSLLLKVKTDNTSSLEQLISQIHSIQGVDHTETMVVLSTHTERTEIQLQVEPPTSGRRMRRIEEGPVTRLKGL